MQEQLQFILVRLYGMWRYRWYAMLLAWLIAPAGWFHVHNMPDVYKSEATLQVDTDSMLRPLLRGLAVETDVTERVRQITQTMLSRPTLERLVQDTDLALRARTPQQMEALISSVSSNIELRVPGQTRRDSGQPYAIAFTDHDPVMAHRVVQTLVDYLVEDTLVAKRSEQEAAQQFLLRQVRQYEERLIESERRLAEFKQRHMGLMPGQGGGFYNRLQAAIELQDQLAAQLRIATERLEQLREQEQNFSRNVFATTIDTEIARHRQDLDQLLLNFTEQHPDVFAKREIIAQLERRKLAEPTGSELEQTLSQDPVYQRLTITINEAEIEMLSLRAQIQDQERRVDELKRLVNTIPEVEAELAKLDRDYLTDRNHRDELLSRLQSAQLSDDVERSSTALSFRIINPPQVPFAPAGPQRLMLNTAVLLAALGIGAGLAFLMFELRPVYLTTKDLRNDLGLPVLGSVTMAWTKWQKRKAKLQLFFLSSSLLLLVGAYLGTVAILRGMIEL